MNENNQKNLVLREGKITMENNKCICQEQKNIIWEVTYTELGWDGDVYDKHFKNIKYCPLCGKMLPKKET